MASKLLQLNYLCMMLIGVTLFLHLATHAFLGVSSYEDSLTFQSVVGRYQSPATAAMLTVLLLTLVYHSLYSFRTFLFELRHGKRWTKAVNWGVVAAGTVMVLFGMRTIVAMYFGWWS